MYFMPTRGFLPECGHLNFHTQTSIWHAKPFAVLLRQKYVVTQGDTDTCSSVSTPAHILNFDS